MRLEEKVAFQVTYLTVLRLARLRVVDYAHSTHLARNSTSLVEEETFQVASQIFLMLIDSRVAEKEVSSP